MKRKISISDVTMKQAAQDGGFSLSFREKLELGKLLDSLGVSAVEMSMIEDKKADSLLVKSLASALKKSALVLPVDFNDDEGVTVAWNAVKGAAHPRLQLCVPVSTVQMEYSVHRKPAAVVQMVGEICAKCKALCPEVEFVADDFTRADKDFLKQTLDAAVASGATLVTVADAAGDMLYDEFFNAVSQVKAMLGKGVRLGVKCSNELSLADACAVAAICAGADEIKAAPFGSKTVRLDRLAKIVSAKEDMCKAGIDIKVTELQRTVGQIKKLCKIDRPAYPSAFSNTVKREIADVRLSASDDRQTVLKAVADLNYSLSPEDADKVYDVFCRIAAKNGSLEMKELDAIVASVAFQVPPTYRLECYVMNSGNTITSTCHIKLSKGEQMLETVCVGDGPVDAAFQAIDKAVGRHYELDDFQIKSVTEGRSAMGEAVVRLRNAGKVYSGRGLSTDIVGSSIRAYISAINKIAYEEDNA